MSMNVTELSRSARESNATSEGIVAPATAREIGDDQVRAESQWNGDLFGGGWEADFNHTMFHSDPDGTVGGGVRENHHGDGGSNE
jgi:hypothetical protein